MMGKSWINGVESGWRRLVRGVGLLEDALRGNHTGTECIPIFWFEHCVKTLVKKKYIGCVKKSHFGNPATGTENSLQRKFWHAQSRFECVDNDVSEVGANHIKTCSERKDRFYKYTLTRIRLKRAFSFGGRGLLVGIMVYMAKQT